MCSFNVTINKDLFQMCLLEFIVLFQCSPGSFLVTTVNDQYDGKRLDTLYQPQTDLNVHIVMLKNKYLKFTLRQTKLSARG